jgi:predicted DsbA family dithiol-disulfide isomerase
MTTIDVYADIWCPFTHVGLNRLVRYRAEHQGDFRLRVHPWPLELVNGKPMDAGFIAEEIDDLREQATPDLFTGFDRGAFPDSTIDALALGEIAYDVDLETGERFSLAIRNALFEEGRNIGDPVVLAELGSAFGLREITDADRALVEASLGRGRARGVVGSPHFFTSSGAFFCPALDIKRVDHHLVIKPDLAGFEAFIAELV